MLARLKPWSKWMLANLNANIPMNITMQTGRKRFSRISKPYYTRTFVPVQSISIKYFTPTIRGPLSRKPAESSPVTNDRLKRRVLRISLTQQVQIQVRYNIKVP